MYPAIILILVVIAAELGFLAYAFKEFIQISLREKHEDPKERRPIINEVKRMVGIKPKGSIFIPPSDADMERQRIIDERSERGEDTPIELLRDNDDEI